MADARYNRLNGAVITSTIYILEQNVNKKNNIYHCKPNFSLYKLGFTEL